MSKHVLIINRSCVHSVIINSICIKILNTFVTDSNYIGSEKYMVNSFPGTTYVIGRLNP